MSEYKSTPVWDFPQTLEGYWLANMFAHFRARLLLVLVVLAETRPVAEPGHWSWRQFPQDDILCRQRKGLPMNEWSVVQARARCMEKWGCVPHWKDPDVFVDEPGHPLQGQFLGVRPSCDGFVSKREQLGKVGEK